MTERKEDEEIEETVDVDDLFIKSSIKVPTVETIKRRTIKDMKELGVHRPQYNRMIDVYSNILHQYYSALRNWENAGSQYETVSAAGTFKTSPDVIAMEKLRKDIITYSDRLMLNPKSIGEEKAKESKQTKLGDLLSKLN